MLCFIKNFLITLTSASEGFLKNIFKEQIEIIKKSNYDFKINVLLLFSAMQRNIFYVKAVFSKDGTVTAANASSLNDGASALILMSSEKANELNLKPLARVVSYADASQEAKWFTTSPAIAINKALLKANILAKDVDYWELNEAFAVVSAVNCQLLNLDPEKVNVYGGAVSMGHPLGCSGARILITLMSVLRQEGGTIGCAGVCNGGGGASAMVLQRMTGKGAL